MKRAFIICGPQSSGNRLLGAILVRAGCWGEGSTNQPKHISEIPSDTEKIVWIHPPCLDTALTDLKAVEFNITIIIIIREPEATCRSMVKAGFYPDLATAFNERIVKIQDSINTASKHNCKIEILTYEGLTMPMLKLWLTRLGLLTNNLENPLNLVGQFAPDFISNQNSKHYVAF
jgi:hypothetical protein